VCDRAGKWARTRRELANCHGARASLSGRTGQQQAAPAGRGREQQQQRCPVTRQSAVWPRRLGCPALPCPVPVWQCACLPALDLFFSPYHGSLSVLLLLVVSFYVLFPFSNLFKKIVFSVYPPPKLWHPLLSLASFFTFLSLLFPSISFFFSPSSSFVGFGRRSQESDLHVHRVLKQRRRRCGL
jgi:hypothetical protein